MFLEISLYRILSRYKIDNVPISFRILLALHFEGEAALTFGSSTFQPRLNANDWVIWFDFVWEDSQIMD